MDFNKESLKLHKIKKGKLAVCSKFSLKNKNDLSIAYTPGVAEPCRAINKNKQAVFDYTIKGNTVAVVTDGSAVLGLGNIGPMAALPVMEGKAILFKEFAGIDAWPICLDTQDTEEIIKTVKYIAPAFGGINLEDISAPRCFEIEERLQNIGIPVFHDDQHGTGVVVLAALINALKVTGKKFTDSTVVINGAGAAGSAIAKLLTNPDSKFKVKNVIILDSKGIIHQKRDNLTPVKQIIAKSTNKNNLKGNLDKAIKKADIFIGVSAPNILSKEMVKSMNRKPIIFAMANPIPEIMPKLAYKAGAAIVATGRSDFPNQVNNVLAFPGIFRGALDARALSITYEMKQSAALALAGLVLRPSPTLILPNPFNKNTVPTIARAVKKARNR